ncbi:MAG: cation transporter [Elusimicrobia bacterium]|nr:cation transporter [Elusimicrobiota bacterium]
MHAHAPSAARADMRRLFVVVGTSAAVLALEVVGGILTNSLALLADAGHVLTDIAGVSIALLAIWFGSRPATERRTFGYYRLEILGAVANGVILFAVAAYVLFEAWRRLGQAPEIASGPMLVIAVLGLAANAFSAWLLRAARSRSLNLRGAYLEVLADMIGSVAVIVAALVIAVTGITAADAIASAFIGLLIVPRTWSLLREAVDVLLEATPRGIDMAHVRRHIAEAPGVIDVHDLHAWTITSGLPVLSAHIVLEQGADADAALDSLSTCLSDHFDITHSTLQLETGDRRYVESPTHA